MGILSHGKCILCRKWGYRTFLYAPNKKNVLYLTDIDGDGRFNYGELNGKPLGGEVLQEYTKMFIFMGWY